MIIYWLSFLSLETILIQCCSKGFCFASLVHWLLKGFFFVFPLRFLFTSKTRVRLQEWDPSLVSDTVSNKNCFWLSIVCLCTHNVPLPLAFFQLIAYFQLTFFPCLAYCHGFGCTLSMVLLETEYVILRVSLREPGSTLVIKHTINERIPVHWMSSWLGIHLAKIGPDLKAVVLWVPRE